MNFAMVISSKKGKNSCVRFVELSEIAVDLCTIEHIIIQHTPVAHLQMHYSNPLNRYLADCSIMRDVHRETIHYHTIAFVVPGVLDEWHHTKHMLLPNPADKTDKHNTPMHKRLYHLPLFRPAGCSYRIEL